MGNLRKENYDQRDAIENIRKLELDYIDELGEKLTIDYELSRKIVSPQANKTQPIYRWFKFKEAYSSGILDLLFEKYSINKGPILDPFAGIGTTLFVSSMKGFQSDGIELLPVGITIINALDNFFDSDHNILINILEEIIKNEKWKLKEPKKKLNELTITKGAYSEHNRNKIEQFLDFIEESDQKIKPLLLLSLLSILESISYTRKDGQYLRWDYRAPRQLRSHTFNKGKILDFDEAIVMKLKQIVTDLYEFENPILQLSPKNAPRKLHKGSCLDILPKLASDNYSVIITSPPYCNRYDYTRTYALELALLGINEEKIKEFRQNMLSCTVENRVKDLLSINSNWNDVINFTKKQPLFLAIINTLGNFKELELLNNNSIVRMVESYIIEMACVIYEGYRVLKNKGYFFMVNDNVRYAGINIPVDIILSDIAAFIGFEIVNILIVPGSKGNSSQQMGTFGKDTLRKCVYVWRKK